MANEPDPLQDMINQHKSDLEALQRLADARKSHAVGGNPLFKFIPDTSEPAPEPVFPPTYPDVPVVSDGSAMPPVERWADVLFKPGYAQAMLYVLMPVIEEVAEQFSQIDSGHGTAIDGGLHAALRQVSAWKLCTFAQRQALTDLFRWVDSQLSTPKSVIPATILANLAAAASQD